MRVVKISPAEISGRAAAPPSKSAAHRALICAALAGGGTVRGVIPSDDMRATLGAVEGLGVRAEYSGDTVTFKPLPVSESRDGVRVVDCRESGSTLRFLIPVYAALGIECRFVGRGRLPQRPLGVYADCLPAHGVVLEYEDKQASLPIRIRGRLESGRFVLPGNVSSQFISGLMFALPLCGGGEIALSSPLESAAYVDMTADALRVSGIVITPTQEGWRIPKEGYVPCEYNVEGDWSQAAFLLGMGALGGEVAVGGLSEDSRQGDRAIFEILKRMGADISRADNGIICRRSRLEATDIDAAQIPDLVPILATLAALARGITRITGASRLRLKESDRLEAIARCLNLLGGHVGQTEDGLIIEGVEGFGGGVTLPGFNDHRIVMSMAVAGLACDSPIMIEDAESVNKSWPEFFDVYKSCGGAANVIQHW